ncbi:hypothetical protein ABZ942_19485 [Nocardia sp. NPDC046473]|uniref:hypothetical protein n=1 Tax=Nocardia sp. NPDC046473 TaxID=3155733 RepID=UPI0033F52280
MGTVSVIGAATLIQGYALAGVAVLVAEDAAAVRRAWNSLAPHTTLVILTATAAEYLATERDAQTALTVVMPI